MTSLRTEDLAVHLTPGDARSTRSAGVKYARTLAGASTGSFLEALAEQEDLVVRWAMEKGFTADQAQTAAREFAAAAEAEWCRIASAGGSTPGGRA